MTFDRFYRDDSPPFALPRITIGIKNEKGRGKKRHKT